MPKLGTVRSDEDIAAVAGGLSAYQVAVNNGFSGTEAEWLASLKGKDSTVPGPKGDTGPQGPAGADSTVPGPAGKDFTPVFALLSSGTLAMGFATNTTVKITPSATQTFTTTVPAAGCDRYLIILTSGTTSRTITFGTGFNPVGTLATGTTSARVFVIHWISDGVNLIESGRTAAIVA